MSHQDDIIRVRESSGTPAPRPSSTPRTPYVTLVVKGGPPDAAGHAKRRGIETTVARTGSGAVRSTVLHAPVEALDTIRGWMNEEPCWVEGYGYAVGTLLTFTTHGLDEDETGLVK
jgi:hypothetical protein